MCNKSKKKIFKKNIHTHGRVKDRTYIVLSAALCLDHSTIQPRNGTKIVKYQYVTEVTRWYRCIISPFQRLDWLFFKALATQKSLFCKDIMLPNNNDSFQVLLQRGVLLAKETTQEVCILSQRPAIVEYYFLFMLDRYIFTWLKKKCSRGEIRTTALFYMM